LKRSLLLFIFLFIPTLLFAQVLTGSQYPQALHKYIAQAKSTVTVAMYFIIVEPGGKGPVTDLVNDLTAAKKRGVKVTVVLEDYKYKENRAAYKMLKNAGVNAAFDTNRHLLHAKGIAIDGRYLFIGSSNWSRAAFERNYEVSVFSDSRKDTAEFEAYVKNIPLSSGDIFFPPQAGVSVDSSFLLSPKGGRILVRNGADLQFDLYLLLCRRSSSAARPSIHPADKRDTRGARRIETQIP